MRKSNHSLVTNDYTLNKTDLHPKYSDNQTLAFRGITCNNETESQTLTHTNQNGSFINSIKAAASAGLDKGRKKMEPLQFTEASTQG